MDLPEAPVRPADGGPQEIKQALGLRRRQLTQFVAGMLGTYLLLLTGFVAGVTADRRGLLPSAAGMPPASLGKSFDTFWQTWQLLREHYVDRGALDTDRLTRGAISGMLQALGDTGHTTYLSADEFKQLTGDLTGRTEGIGIRVTVQEQQATIGGTLPGSPARAAGLHTGDVLLQVDGTDVADLPLDAVAKRLRGPAGSTVRLQVRRPTQAKPLEFVVTRRPVAVPSVTWEWLSDSEIGHVAIRNFGTQTDDELKTALRQLRELGARGLVLDLRGNHGGLRDQAIAVTSQFLGTGNVYIEVDARGRRMPMPVTPGGESVDVPLVVLIDHQTASSAEIFAGALQDAARAKLVGSQTFGTGTVIQPFQLKDGSAVLLAVAKWLTPKGREIWRRGLAPDVRVDLPEGVAIHTPDGDESAPAADDAQLQVAKKVLESEMTTQPTVQRLEGSQ